MCTYIHAFNNFISYSRTVVASGGSLGSSNLSIVCVWKTKKKPIINMGSSMDNVNIPIHEAALKYGSQS